MQILNSAGEVVGVLSNQKVRHHKFPSTSWLHANSVPYVVQSGAVSNVLCTLTHSGWSSNRRTFTVGGFTETDAGAFSLGNRRFTVNKAKYLYISMGVQAINGEHRLKYTYKGELKEAIQSIDAGAVGGLYFLVSLDKGDYVEFEWYSPDETGTGAVITITDLNIEDITLESQVLGVDLEDIFIPPAIRSNIAYMELGYAERDSNNSLVMAEGLIHPWRDGILDTTPTNLAHSFAFDLLHFKPDLSNCYISMQLALTGSELYNFTGVTTFTNLANSVGSGGTTTTLPPINFGNRNLLVGTQWEKLLDPNYGKIPEPVQYGQPSDLSYNDLMGILGNRQGMPSASNLTINDIISGIQNQYGQVPSRTMG